MRHRSMRTGAIVISILIIFGATVSAYAAGPSIQSLRPTSAPVGGGLVIAGSGFGQSQGSSTVTVNNTPVTVFAFWSATQIYAEVPIGATTGNVIVKVGGSNSNGVRLTVVPAPSITSLSASSGPIGSSITITGTNLRPSSTLVPYVYFSPTGGCSNCGIAVTPTLSSNTSCTVQVPAGATSGKVSVQYDYVNSNPLSFTVTGTLAPVADAGLNDVVPLGSTVRLDGTHSYDLNGLALTYQWSLSSVPTGSNAVLSNSTAAFTTFVADLAGEYVVQLSVSNGSLTSQTSAVLIDTPNYANEYPRPNAGPDQTVGLGATVFLDGSNSTNPSGTPLSNYLWCLWYAPNDSSQQVYQGTTPFSNPAAINPTFVANNAGSYYAVLWQDGNGGCDAELGPSGSGPVATPDFVKISTVNSQPIANAGPNQSIQVAQTVQLDGTGSTDVDGNPLTYSWTILTKPSGSAATLTNPTSPQPTFNADLVGTYVAQLIVNDGTVNSLPGLSEDPVNRTSTVTITNLDVTPVANPGPAQTVPVGSFVGLDGAASSDVDGHALAYKWALISRPTSSQASLTYPTSETPYFTADVAGKYVVQLIVNDGIADSAPATVLISTDSSRPVANAGPHQIVTTGSAVQLSGADSYDADGKPLSYKWAILYEPSGANAFLSSSTVEDPTFVAATAGLYVVQLIVSDGLNSAPVTTWIKAQANQPPVVSAGPNQTITLPVNRVTLEGSATDDGLPNGTLTVSWTQVSGPGTAIFSSPSTAVSDATFPTQGVYVLQLTANDSQLQSSSSVTITVNPGAINASLTAVQTATVNVSGTTGPWSVTLNNSYSYGNSGVAAPVAFPVQAGEQLNFQYLSGLVSIGFSYPSTDASGVPNAPGNGFGEPAYYALQYANGGALVGAWTDLTGRLVAAPFAINDGVTVTAPAGAMQVQLGVNDVYYNDNLGSWSIQIQTGIPLLAAGPNVTGTSQTLNAYVTAGGVPVSGARVQFTVTGANSTTASVNTNNVGIASFSYTGANRGTDSVQATYGTYSTNAVSVTWITPVQNISLTASIGKFFASNGSCNFGTSTTTVPAFTQEFPNITFNPPANFVAGNSTINEFTVPFTDVTTDQNGNFTGTIPAQGNGYQAGVGSMGTSFQAVFAGSFVVKQAGNLSLEMVDDGGFILGVGGGAQRLSGILVNPPSSGVTPFNGLPVMGAYNQAVQSGPESNIIAINFPTAGTYPYELDYTVCNGSSQVPMTLAMGVGASNSTPAAPAGSLVLTPTNPATNTVGQSQTITIQATDGSGLPIPNLSILVKVYGANQQYLNGTTNTSGQATLNYIGGRPGTDTIQALSTATGAPGVSNVTSVTWGGVAGTYIFTPQGWIASPTIGSVIQNQVPITLISGVTLTSGTLKYFPSNNPTQVTILNSNTTGTGPLTLGTFDATSLADGQYTIQLQTTSSTGVGQLNEIVVSVTGEYKPGREVVTVTDLKIPLAGIPISISRTYDSLNRGSTGDFGNGWNLGTNVQLAVDQLMNVTLTLNGKRQTFNFTPQSAGQALFPWVVVPHYTPQPGLFGTLTSNGCDILILASGALVQDSMGIACFPAGSYQPTVYTYTDPSGRVYTISSTGQLQSIQDLNGNVLTFAANGITGSVGGVVVPFVRDSQGRITQITDLNQNNYVYSYDSPCGTGNLCSVTFPGSPTIQATYTYFSDHSLNTQSDPNSNTTTYSYYADGRLQSMTTPSVPAPGGTQTQFVTQYCYTAESACSINTANTTKVTNPDGGVVTTVVDSFGNPISVTDALQNTTTYTYYPNELVQTMTDPLQNPATQYTYDANNFPASVTDPLGHKTTWINNQFGGVTQTADAAQQNTTNIGYDSYFNPITVTDSVGQVWTRTYDSMGDILTQSDANGNTTQFTYDSRGNLIKQVDAMNEVTTFTYDGMDRMLTQTDPRGNQTTYTYDALGNLIDTTDAVGHDIRATYDLNGNKTSDIDALGRITFYSYDALNRLTKITYPDNSTKQYTYDFRNNKLTEIDQSGRTSQYQYDLAGRLKNVTHAYGTSDAGTVQYTYDKDGNQKTVTDEVTNQTTYFYDAANRLQTKQDAKGNQTLYGYDADNRLTSVEDANQHTTRYTPDPRGRITTVTYPDTTTDKYVYDGVGNRTKKTDQASNVTQWTYDTVNRLSSVKDALLNVTIYAYDTASNLTSITDANIHITSFQYDSLNRKALRQLPVGMVETFSYDPAGNLSAKTDFNGKNTTFTYDTLNRLLKKIPDPSLSQPTITFTYYPTGTRQTMGDATGTTNYTYDNRDRLKIKATPEGTLNYTYDAHSNLLSIASSNANGASVTYAPDQLNRLSTVTDNRLAAQGVSSPITTYGYDPAGNMNGYTYSADGLQSTYGYDTLNRLSQVTWNKGTNSLSSFTYVPYPAGNVHTVNELSNRNVTYVYDNDYHLQSETIASDPGGNNGQESYTYDAGGNRKTLNSTIPSLPGSVSYNYDANDRLTTDTYDNDGNTIVSVGISYTYDFENRMLMKGAVAMVYDGDGNRVSETAGGVTTKYLIDTVNPTGYSQVMDEIVNGSVSRTYTYGRQLISENQLVSGTWTPSFYGYDGHGNARFLANAAGAITDSYTFDAFGAPIASTGTTPNPYLYSGERFDSSLNLYHLRARYYNALTGRFETMDPAAGKITDPATLHKYAYTKNNPVNEVDPTGKDIAEDIYMYAVRIGTAAPGLWALERTERTALIIIGCVETWITTGMDPDSAWSVCLGTYL